MMSLCKADGKHWERHRIWELVNKLAATAALCVPLLAEAQNLWFRTILSEISENHVCILQYLATVALKTEHKIDTFFVKCSKHFMK